MKKYSTILLISLLFISLSVQAQIKVVGNPYIKNYDLNKIEGSIQNWCAVQDFRGIMYFANSSGVFEFDGINFRKIETSKKSSVLSLALSNDKKTIYVGGSADLGYLAPDSCGYLQFVSLLDKVPEKYRAKIKVTGIAITNNNEVIYCSKSQIFNYSNDTISVLSLDDNSQFVNICKCNEKIYIFQTNLGYCELTNSQSITLESIKGSQETQIVTSIPSDQGTIFVSRSKGLLTIKNGFLTEINAEINPYLISEAYCAQRLNDGNYAFGLLNQGLIITDKNFKPIKILKVYNGLCSNQIISILQLENNGIWLSTQNGICYVDLYSPLSYFPNIYNNSIVFQNNKNLYLGGSNLYSIPIDSINSGIVNRNLYKQIKHPTENNFGTIRGIDTLEGQFVCWSEKGIFAEKNNSIYLTKKGSLSVRTLIRPSERPDLLIGGCQAGLCVYSFQNDKWQFRNSINEGFDIETVRIVEDDEHNYWVSKTEIGIYKLKIDSNFTKVIDTTLYDSAKGLPGYLGNYIFKIDNDIVAATYKGFYEYNKSKDIFVESTKYNKFLNNHKYITNHISKDKCGNIWICYFAPNKRNNEKGDYKITCFKPTSDSTYIDLGINFSPLTGKFKKFSEIEDKCFFISCTDELVHYDLKFSKNYKIPYHAYIRAMKNIESDSIIFGGAFLDNNGNIDSIQNNKKNYILPYSQNGIKFEFSTNTFDYPEYIKFKYFLENNDNTWSDWKSDNFKEFTNLSPGKYTFHVIAKNVWGIESQEATLTFTILPPWYLTIWAFIIYSITLIALIFGIVKLNSRRLEQEKQELERIVSERTAEIMEKNKEITEKNKSITDSINYAKRIQDAMLPFEDNIKKALPEHFILFRPRDIVSGDFYWFAETPDRIIITAVDCTGHGVPGAFMSMIGAEILTTLVNKGIVESDNILTHQNRYIRKALKQDLTDNQDGMDMALCSIDKKRNVLEYSGAKNPLVYIKNDELVTIKADKQGIGGNQYETNYKYTKHEIPIEPGTWYYMFSDGFPDQFGGIEHRKFMIKYFRDLLFKIHNKPADIQKKILNDTIEKWMVDGQTEQTDDIIVIGFKL